MTAFIKPAVPNNSTFQLIQNNTNDWTRNNFLILRDHYDQVISNNLLNLPTFNLETYNRALKWAPARYGRKLTRSSVDTLRAMIMNPDNRAPDSSPPDFVIDQAPQRYINPTNQHMNDTPPPPLNQP